MIGNYATYHGLFAWTYILMHVHFRSLSAPLRGEHFYTLINYVALVASMTTLQDSESILVLFSTCLFINRRLAPTPSFLIRGKSARSEQGKCNIVSTSRWPYNSYTMAACDDFEAKSDLPLLRNRLAKARSVGVPNVLRLASSSESASKQDTSRVCARLILGRDKTTSCTTTVAGDDDCARRGAGRCGVQKLSSSSFSSAVMRPRNARLRKRLGSRGRVKRPFGSA